MNKLRVLLNNLLALKNYRQKKTTLSNLPTYIWLEPTNYCNLRCVMCPNGTGMVKTHKGYMEFDLFRDVIDQLEGFASSITLAVGGESLLHPQFFEMVRYCKTKRIKVLLNTNATLLDGDKAQQLLDADVDYISFAFDGFNKKSYEKARRGAVFEDTLEKIIYFLKLKQKKQQSKTYCVLSALNLELAKQTDQDKKIFSAKLENLIDEIRIREVASWGSTFKDEKSFSHREHENVYTPCSRLWSTACITWDGDMVPCIYNANHEYILGNLKEQKFADIWNGKQMVQLRNTMLNNSHLDVSPLCENCIVLGTPPLFSIPSGLRLTLADAAVNFFGYQSEKFLLKIANLMLKKKFTAITLE